MFNGEAVTFDLADGAPSFTFAKDFTVSSNDHFLRKVSVKYQEGNLKSYVRRT